MARHKLPFSVVYTKARKLRDMFCRSRPLDKLVCTREGCKVCDRLAGAYNCKVKGPVYKVICNYDGENYRGESGRTAYDRLGEHYNYTKNPNAKSYKAQTLAKHYSLHHNGLAPNLTFEITDIETNTLKRKIIEAYRIRNENPTLNDKNELDFIKRYMI